MTILRRLCTFTAAVLLLATVRIPAHGSALTPPPLVVTASAGPAAGSHILATVTRTVGSSRVTLPAALVPALEPGDTVDLDFPDYRRPPGRVNYHVNAAFITEAAPQHWLFERSGSADRLFSGPHRKGRVPATTGKIHFAYGTGDKRGIPIFFIVPEDAKTRGMDGVRDYVDAHPTDFVGMSQSTNAAVDRYSFLSDFLNSLGSGSIDPVNAQQRIDTIAQGFGVSPATIDACYAAGGSSAVIGACVQQAIDATVDQTNFAAPTQAQFLGGLAGAVNPATYAPYIDSLLTVWRLFVHTGHQEYEYLPTTLTLADPSTARHDELLMGLKVPTIRPPGAVSDALFFTIGDPQATEHAPVVVNAAPAAGMCARTERFTVPLHFDHTSRYVHDAALIATPDDGTPQRVAIDPRTLAAPTLARSQLAPSRDGAYSLGLTGMFGFQSVGGPAPATFALAVPGDAPWTIADMPHHRQIAGASLDIIASSPSAPCLSRAEIQIGSAAPVPLAATVLDTRRIEMRASLASLPAGPATVRIYEDDARSGRAIETDTPLRIEAPAPAVGASPAAALGDPFVALEGTGLERVRGMRIAGAVYAKSPSATATAACFTGPPLGARDQLAPGQQTGAELLTLDGSPGQIFPLTLEAARPAIASATITPADSGTRLATSPFTIALQSAGALPLQFAVRVRKPTAEPDSPCDAVASDPTSVTIAPTNVHLRTASSASVIMRADVLGDRGFGTLELQLVDMASKRASAWIAIPGTFARAPIVAQIACPAATDAPCRLYGTELAAIDGIRDATGGFTAPLGDCPPTAKGVACVYVPHLAHYVLRLIDGGITDDVPDGVETSVPQ